MKTTMKYVLVGSLVATITQTNAQQWEQNFNVALVAQVQTADGTAKRVAIPT